MKTHRNSELDTASTSKTTTQKTKRDEEGGLQPQPKRQATLSEIINKKSLYVDDDVRAKDITLTIAEQICVDMEPFDLVNKIGFQRLIKKLCPKYKMVSRFHITEKVIPEMYQRVRAKVLELLKDLPHIVITTDIWTSDSSSQSNDFISLTAHGITATFDYKSYCLEVLPFDGSHTGINIASNLNKAFHDWNIQDRVRAIVSDNAANMSVAIREIQETYNVVPVKCLAHSLQLVIKARLFKHDKVKEMITKARSIIGHFSHSTSSNKVLKEMQDTHNIANHVLIQDISTRWDSTLQALRRLLEQRVAVQACLPRITCKAELTTEEWIMMEKVVNILRYFEEATKSISKSTATLSDAIPLINSLRKLLENMRGSSPRRGEYIAKISG
ncbi:Zinc finger BED domain-containing protein 4 [Eumeta japonica]|uniref:Zinc finger BED domain-containing protein 4 n=1 Tax=Eumeta variegata TaxID=151549 RepID=A0A4C1WUT4_EUMVA|nr:Zinc finger BED domain-containing protein 4 [Eumeta japonica]